jgi:hypothetical protein
MEPFDILVDECLKTLLTDLKHRQLFFSKNSLLGYQLRPTCGSVSILNLEIAGMLGPFCSKNPQPLT